MRPLDERVAIAVGSTPMCELRRVIGELLSQRWSPQQISRHLRQRFPDDPAMWLCHESIAEHGFDGVAADLLWCGPDGAAVAWVER